MLDFPGGKLFSGSNRSLIAIYGTQLSKDKVGDFQSEVLQVINSDAGKGDVKTQQRGQEREKTEDSKMAY